MSKKTKVRFLCSDCGDDFPQWFGRCPSCKEWNTLKEFHAPSEPDTVRASSGSLLAARRSPKPSGFFASAAAPVRGGLLGGKGAESARAESVSPPGAVAGADTEGPGAPSDPEATQAAPRVQPASRAQTAPAQPAAPAAPETAPAQPAAPAAPAQKPRAVVQPTPPPIEGEPPEATAPVSRSRPHPAPGTPVESRPRPVQAAVVPPPGHPGGDRVGRLPTLLRLEDVPLAAVPRLSTGIREFDRVLGGGLVAGSVILIGGDPGIGKSTLLLQVAGKLVAGGATTLYVTGEESAGQIRLRAERLPGIPPNLLIHTETNLEEVAQAVAEIRPRVLIVDSIQTAYLPGVASAPGSVTQVRESALALIEVAKREGICVLLVGHVTKDGTIAGPKTLEHMVDAVVYMEGERYQHYRILRSVKNRFGGVDELGVFEMGPEGLVEVANPSRAFLSEHTAGAVGSVVATSIEGTRALLLEVQALVVQSQYANPQRVSTGYDRRRLEILLAVLDKRTQLDLARRDVFVNIAGGLRVVEPGVDLGVLLAVASSATDTPPHGDLVAIGEVGLGGEVRRIAHPERRIQEMARLGYKRALLPWANARDLGPRGEGVELLGVRSVTEALEKGLNTPAPQG